MSNGISRFDSQKHSLVLLAPRNWNVETAFRNVFSNDILHDQLQGEMQRLRGSIYLRDGAIPPSELTSDGRHWTPMDDESWHLLLMDDEGSIGGCARYHVHPGAARFEDLRVAKSALAGSAEWGAVFRLAVETELAESRRLGLSYIEMGGWAMADRFRGTSECLRSVLASYALARLIGGALGICPATERNGSAAILRRMGGHLLEVSGTAIPPYFDAGYGCKMQMLRFDSRTSITRYEDTVQELMASLAQSAVICANVPAGRPRKTRISITSGWVPEPSQCSWAVV